MPTAYAEVLEASWTAVPYSDAAIALYPTSPVDGGFVGRTPTPIPASNPVADAAWDAATYVDSAGNRRWVPTPGDEDLIGRVTANPYDGLDELVESAGASAGRAAGSNIDDVIGQLGGRAGIGAGAAIGGVLAGYGEYASGGGLASAAAVGVGAGIGGAAGTVIGGAIGTVAGPVGVAIGGAIGGAIGSAIGAAIGDALIPDANRNGAQATGAPPFTGGQCDGVVYLVTYSPSSQWNSGQSTTGFVVGPVSGIQYVPLSDQSKAAIVFDKNGASSSSVTMDINAPEDGRIIGLSRLDGGADSCGDPAPGLETYDPNGDPTRTRPRRPIIDLPGVPLPRRRPRGRGRGFDPDGYRPTGEPVPGVDDDGNPIDPSLPDGYPDPAPYPDPTGDDGRDGDNGDGDGDGDGECDPCEKLDEILELLKQPFSGEMLLEPCGEGDAKSYGFEDEGLTGLHLQLKSLSRAVKDIWDAVKCGPGELALPESWAIRTSRTLPQYVVIWKVVGRGIESSWSSTIPHPRYHRASDLVSAYQHVDYVRGNFQATIQNADNTHSIVNCKNKPEATKMRKWINRLQNPEVVQRQKMKLTEGIVRENPIEEIRVEPTLIKYFATGAKTMTPDWVVAIKDRRARIF